MTEGTEYQEPPAELEAENHQPDPVAPVSVVTDTDPAVAEEPAQAEPAAERSDTEPEQMPLELPELELIAEEPAEPADDDVAAAIAEAGENVEAEPTFDDIAPGTVAVEPGCDVIGAVEPDEHANSVSIWPFVVYDALWLLFVGLLIWRFQPLPADRAVFESTVYPLVVLVGSVLTIAGPLLILGAWIGSWGRPGSTKAGLFFSALIKGSVATLVGVVLWWAALIILDQIRLGRLL